MVTFDINGAIIEFNEKMDNYNKVRKLFKLYAIEVSKKFYNICLENYQSTKNFQEYSLSEGLRFREEGLRKAIETIIGFDVITIDIDIFKSIYCEKYFNYERFSNNLMRNKLNNKNRKNIIIKNEELKSIFKKLSEYLYYDCFNIHLGVIDALLKNNVDNIDIYIDEDSKQKSNALFNNYKDGFIVKLDESRVVKQIIHLNPYRKDVYEFLIREDGDFNKEIEKLTDYLGYDIKDYKSHLMNEYVKDLLNDNNSDVNTDKEKIEKYAKYIGYTDCSIYKARIDAIYTFANA